MLETCTQGALVNLAVNKSEFAEVQVSKSWPSPQDYNEAMQNPAMNLAVPELKNGKPGLNKLGLPKAISGSFASVYYLDCPKQDFAIRCFLHNIVNQRERYAKISEHLNQFSLAILADFEYVDKGILVDAIWYPILKMDWVDGQNLIEYIGRNLDNAKVLEQLRLWLRQACQTLKEHGIAHGDLQHGNVLVLNDSVKLVDYDGIFVPQLVGQVSNELGHRNYQHPGRTKEHFGPYLDNFSLWLIDTCLFVLERDPRVWLTLHAGEDCLLFRERDLHDPYSSFAFHELESHPNVEIRDRVKLLRWLLSIPVDQVPDIHADIMTASKHLMTLDPSKKKPDWLSSAANLAAEEVVTSNSVPEVRNQPIENLPSFPLGSQTATGNVDKRVEMNPLLVVFFVMVSVVGLAFNAAGPWLLTIAFLMVFIAFRQGQGADACYRRGVHHFRRGNLLLADKNLANALNHYYGTQTLGPGSFGDRECIIFFELAVYFLDRGEKVLAHQALKLIELNFSGNPNIDKWVQQMRYSMKPGLGSSKI